MNPGRPQFYEDYTREPESTDIEKRLENYKLEVPAGAKSGALDLMAEIRANRKVAGKERRQYGAPMLKSVEGKKNSIRVEASLQSFAPLAFETKKSEIAQKTLIATKSAQAFIKEREYEDMMDQHALQIFMVRQGKIVEETPEYQSFKRLAGGKWVALQPFLLALSKLIKQSGAKLVYINGSALLEVLAKKARPAYPSLLACVTTEAGGSGPSFLASMRRRACIKLQSVVRMRLAMRLVRKMKVVLSRVKHIQHWWMSVKARREFLRNGKQRGDEVMKRFEERQEQFQLDWPQIKTTSRVEIHYANISGSELKKLGIERYKSRVSLQVGRVFRAMQDKVEVVLVTPGEVPEEIKMYYYKILEMADVRLGGVRVHFISVQGGDSFPEHFCTPSKILCSRSTLRAIKRVESCDVRLWRGARRTSFQARLSPRTSS